MTLLRRFGSVGLKLLPFELVLRAQPELAKISALRRLAYPRELDLLDRFLDELGVRDRAEIESARRERCLATWINHTHRHYMRLPTSRQAVWLKLDADIEAALRPGALLVGSHFGCGLLTPLALAQLGIEIVAIVHTPDRPRLPVRFLRPLDLSKESPIRVVGEARWTLRRGGVVFLAGDLATGRPESEIEVDVLGRRRRIARGFAELSIASSVPPTPVFSRVDQAGNIFTWVEPALTTAALDGEPRVAELARAYADRLSANYARYPGNVSPPAIRIYFGSENRRAVLR